MKKNKIITNQLILKKKPTTINSRSHKIIQFILSRYLFLSWMSHKKERQGSPISVLIPVLGVSVGVFAFLVVVSVMSGFVQNLKLNILHFEPHIEVTSKVRGHEIENNSSFISQIKSVSNEILKISPFQSADVILQANQKGVIANLQGLHLSSHSSDDDLEKYLSFGSHLSDLNLEMSSSTIQNSSLFPTVILGLDLMNQLNLHVGDTLTLVSPFLDDSPDGFSPTQFPVVIAGYLNSGHFSFDKKIVLSSLKTANAFLNLQNKIQGYYITLKNPMNAENVAQKLNQYFLKNNSQISFVAKPWTENNKSFLKALTLEHYGMIFVLIMIILVACFSITISLLLSIRKKSREMAILRSLGLKQIELSKIYLWQGFIIGLLGIIIGLSFGFVALYFIHHYPIPFMTTAYSSEPLTVVVSFLDVFIVVFGTLFLSMFAAVWPAYEVRNLNVIETLSLRN